MKSSIVMRGIWSIVLFSIGTVFPFQFSIETARASTVNRYCYDNFFGISDGFEWQAPYRDEWFAEMAKAKIKSVRASVKWRYIENTTTNPAEQGVFVWDKADASGGFDSLFNDIRTNGLCQMGVLGLGHLNYCCAWNGFSTEAVIPFWNFGYALMNRYGWRIADYEIWNEPNLSGFMTVTPDTFENRVSQYKNIMDTAIDCFSAYQAQAGGTRYLIGGSASEMDAEWINNVLFDQEDYAQYLDGISCHPYAIAELNDTKLMQQAFTKFRASFPNHRVYFSEIAYSGMNGFKGAPSLAVAQEDQANALTKVMVTSFIANVTKVYWWSMMDSMIDQPAGYQGLINADNIKKPAWYAYVNTASNMVDHRYLGYLQDVNKPYVYAYVFSNAVNGRLKILAWADPLRTDKRDIDLAWMGSGNGFLGTNYLDGWCYYLVKTLQSTNDPVSYKLGDYHTVACGNNPIIIEADYTKGVPTVAHFASKVGAAVISGEMPVWGSNYTEASQVMIDFNATTNLWDKDEGMWFVPRHKDDVTRYTLITSGGIGYLKVVDNPVTNAFIRFFADLDFINDYVADPDQELEAVRVTMTVKRSLTNDIHGIYIAYNQQTYPFWLVTLPQDIEKYNGSNGETTNLVWTLDGDNSAPKALMTVSRAYNMGFVISANQGDDVYVEKIKIEKI